jgi:hypothetical protein
MGVSIVAKRFYTESNNLGGAFLYDREGSNEVVASFRSAPQADMVAMMMNNRVYFKQPLYFMGDRDFDMAERLRDK